MYRILIYRNSNDYEPFTDWIDRLDKTVKARIMKRILRMKDGYLGDYKHIEQGVCELRFFFGGGYRVYFAKQDEVIFVLLGGGDKSTQVNDIQQAKIYWKEYKHA